VLFTSWGCASESMIAGCPVSLTLSFLATEPRYRFMAVSGTGTKAAVSPRLPHPTVNFGMPSFGRMWIETERPTSASDTWDGEPPSSGNALFGGEVLQTLPRSLLAGFTVKATILKFDAERALVVSALNLADC
jgi:hypothetical protein